MASRVPREPLRVSALGPSAYTTSKSLKVQKTDRRKLKSRLSNRTKKTTLRVKSETDIPDRYVRRTTSWGNYNHNNEEVSNVCFILSDMEQGLTCKQCWGNTVLRSCRRLQGIHQFILLWKGLLHM